MNRNCRNGFVSLLLASSLTLSGPFALASDESREKAAQQFFVEAMRLMSAKKYADACEKFAQSLELDPGLGTHFRLAEGYETWVWVSELMSEKEIKEGVKTWLMKKQRKA